MFLLSLLAVSSIPYTLAQDYYTVVIDVKAPASVEPGQTVTVQIIVEYDFPLSTEALIGIYDPMTYDVIKEYEFDDEGSYESSFSLDIVAPQEEGDYELVADIFYLKEGEWYYTEGSEMYFTITVKKAGFSIPAFPIAATLLGLVAVVALRKRDK